jgi:cell division septal protein FtsQ
MASYPNVASSKARPAFLAQPLVFQRGEGTPRAKKTPKRIALRAKHVALLFFLFAGTSYSLCRAYLFLISWDKLTVRSVQVVCDRPALKQQLDLAFEGKSLGNILLCDIDGLRTQVRAFIWVKEARIRKVFPCSLRIEVTERTPRALVQGYGLTLVDEEGVELERPASADAFGLPVLADQNGFRNGRPEKLGLAWQCLDDLSPEERSQVAGLDLTNPGTVDLRFRDDPVRIKLGDRGFKEKVRFYGERKTEWENEFGDLEYVDLRFDGRVYLKARELQEKEVS